MTGNLPPTSRFDLDDLKNALEFYQIFGYVIFKDFFSRDELSDFKNDVVNIINAQAAKANIPSDSGTDAVLNEGIIELEKIDHDHVAAVYDTIFQTPSFFRISGNRAIEMVVKQLMGLDQKTGTLYGFTNRCRIDPPNDRRRTYGWHQECFYTIPKGNYIQTWAPLIFDTDRANGTIEVAAGSHKEGVAPQTWNDTQGKATQIIVDDEIVAKYARGSVDMKVGELMFFSGFLCHRSGNNSSSQVRYSLVGMYHDVAHIPFMAPQLDIRYRGSSPRDYFNDHFNS